MSAKATWKVSAAVMLSRVLGLGREMMFAGAVWCESVVGLLLPGVPGAEPIAGSLRGGGTFAGVRDDVFQKSKDRRAGERLGLGEPYDDPGRRVHEHRDAGGYRGGSMDRGASDGVFQKRGDQAGILIRRSSP